MERFSLEKKNLKVFKKIKNLIFFSKKFEIQILTFYEGGEWPGFWESKSLLKVCSAFSLTFYELLASRYKLLNITFWVSALF